MRIEGLRKDLAIGLILFALSLTFFWPVTMGGKTMLPADNAFEWEPWKSFAPQLGVGVPHNSLLSDLYLQNYVWKRFIVNSLRARQIPLWNPYIFAGVPFLAAGQHSAMYPLSILFYVLPIPMAYGWFAALHIFLAGLFTYILARTLRISRVGGTIAAVTFMFCGFMVTHNVFPMIIASVVWLPLILALIERLVRRAEQNSGHFAGYIPELGCGSLAFGMVFLAGHPEMYYYVCLTSGVFALWRLAGLWMRERSWLRVAAMAGGLLMMVGLGAGLGSAQWVPLFDVVRYNFREGSATFKQVLGWAYPLRHIVALFIPDFYGNPTHHTYFDLFTRRIVPVTVDARGQPINTIFWGIKNYVEGASYLGLLPTLLAAIALLKRKGERIWFFALLALVSILFVFGNPLYIVVYKLPGLNQVHSPFRWIYPYSLSVAILAGMGLDALWHKEIARGSWQKLLTWLAEAILPKLALAGGSLMLVGLGISLLVKERMAALAERALHRLALAENAFANGRMFYSYEFRNLLIFALALFLSGLVLFMRPRFRGSTLWGVFVALVTLGELFVIGKSFLPAVDPSLIAFRPPAIEFLKRDTSLYRVTSFVGTEKPLNANSGMFFDIQDVRGYDSIIPKQYVEMMRLIQEQSELQYNRIAPIFVHHPEALDAPLIDMLNVKYILATKERQITNRGYKLVYEGELRIYQNEEALPRAFLVPKALSIPDVAKRHEALRSFDPRQVVILEEEVPAGQVEGNFCGQVEAIDYGANEVLITFNASAPGFLVLGDSYAKGWLAFIRPPDAPDPTRVEQRLHIYRANGNFRAVHVPAGRHVVRFKYSPNAVKYGFYLSFLAGIMLMLGIGAWAWLRFYSRPQEEATAQRVTRNTVTPITLSLVNKVIDMAFAMLMLRILGDANAGRLYYAIVVISWFDILTNFGLNTLLTREVAKDRVRANAYLSNTTITRMGLCVLSVPVLGLFFALRGLFPPRLEPSTVLAIWLFGIGLVPSNISAGLSAVLMAYERMEMPAFVTTVTTVLKVSLQTVVLILTKSYVGLAATSIVVNLITMLILYTLVRVTLFRPRLEVDWGFQRRMLREAYPLMINSLLATLFFKVAVLLLEGLVKDDRVVGWYSAAYKYLDAVGVIPAYFTMAIFPLMARYAATARGSLLKAYRLAIKLLTIIAVPGALVGWALSKELITILGGSQYLPYAANILQVMVWYMPIGFINSVTQYVLIALEQQRFLTRAFAIGLGFNIVANVVLISRFGFMAAGYVAVISELALFIPFYVGIRKHLSAMPWLQLAWKQILCAVPLALLCILLPRRFLPLSILVGLVCYVAGLAGIGVFDQEEREAVQRVIPLNRIRNRIAQTFMRDSVPS